MNTWDEMAREQLGHVPSRNFNANHCEFHIDGTYGHSFARAGDSEDSLTFYFYINRPALAGEQGGQVRLLGAFVKYEDRGEGEERTHFLWTETNELRLSVTSMHAFAMPRPVHSELLEFAFFLDVERSDGIIDRLWLKNGEANFRGSDISNRIGESFGPNVRYYIAESSPIFYQKQACKH